MSQKEEDSTSIILWSSTQTNRWKQQTLATNYLRTELTTDSTSITQYTLAQATCHTFLNTSLPSRSFSLTIQPTGSSWQLASELCKELPCSNLILHFSQFTARTTKMSSILTSFGVKLPAWLEHLFAQWALPLFLIGMITTITWPRLTLAFSAHLYQSHAVASLTFAHLTFTFRWQDWWLSILSVLDGVNQQLEFCQRFVIHLSEELPSQCSSSWPQFLELLHQTHLRLFKYTMDLIQVMSHKNLDRWLRSSLSSHAFLPFLAST